MKPTNHQTKMKIKYLFPGIASSNEIGKENQEENANEFLARGIRTIVGELDGKSPLILRECADTLSVILECKKTAVVLVGFGKYFEHVYACNPTHAANAILEALCKPDEFVSSEGEEAVKSDFKSSGISYGDICKLIDSGIQVMGRLEAYSGSEFREFIESINYHPPMVGQTERYETIRDLQKQVAGAICSLCPPSNELQNALKSLYEVGFWANAAIARNEKYPVLPISVESVKEAINELKLTTKENE